MKHILIAGNWKSNKTTVEAKEWLADFKIQALKITEEQVTIILFVPFTLLYPLKEAIAADHLPILLGAENVSPFPEGAETGEESASMVKDLADWVIIGHSERRKNFGETDDMLAKKVAEAKKAGLKIIYCVPDANTVVPEGVDVVGYEPVWAIGTGKTDSPENANSVTRAIKAKTHVQTVIYGGSVTPANVASFVKEEYIDGVLPGGASLQAESFAGLIFAATQV